MPVFAPCRFQSAAAPALRHGCRFVRCPCKRDTTISAINWERVCHAPALSIYGSISTLLRCSIQTFRKRLRQPGHLDKYVILSDIAPFPARGPPFSLEHQHGMALAVRPASASHTLGQMGIH